MWTYVCLLNRQNKSRFIYKIKLCLKDLCNFTGAIFIVNQYFRMGEYFTSLTIACDFSSEAK